VRRALALSFVLLLDLPAAAEPQAPLVVVLDPGHGGRWPHDGAHGRRGLHEKVIALQVAQKTKELLEGQGATVILTRDTDDDVPLADRVRIANEAGADVFVSIHCNAMEKHEDRKVTRGVETYFLSPDPTDAEAKMLAQLENGGPEAVPLPKANDAVMGILNDLALGQARNDSAALAQIVQQHMVRGTRAPSRERGCRPRWWRSDSSRIPARAACSAAPRTSGRWRAPSRRACGTSPTRCWRGGWWRRCGRRPRRPMRLA